MAIKEYEVKLRLRVENENPTRWDWYTLLNLDPNESVKVLSCDLIREQIPVLFVPQNGVQYAYPTYAPEVEDWLPEQEDVDQ